MENHHLCQASIVIQQPTSVTALESGAVSQAGGYCSTTGGPSHVPTTASTVVEAVRIRAFPPDEHSLGEIERKGMDTIIHPPKVLILHNKFD